MVSCLCKCRGAYAFVLVGQAHGYEMRQDGIQEDTDDMARAFYLTLMIIFGAFIALSTWFILTIWIHQRRHRWTHRTSKIINNEPDLDNTICRTNPGGIFSYSGNSADEGMPPAGRRAAGNSGGGGGKKGRGGGNDDDDLSRMLSNKMDLRSQDQKERDIRRRLGTQCVFNGWFRLLPGESPTNPGSKKIYRRCTKSQSANHMPWCQDHWQKEDDDPNEDPGLPKPKKGGGPGGAKKGLGLPSTIFGWLGEGKTAPG